jgi:hypothetical protein
MEPRLTAQLRMEGDRDDVALSDRDRMRVHRGQDLDLGAVLSHPRGANEDGVHRAARDPGEVQIGLKGAQLASERVALGPYIEDAEVLAVKHDEPGAGPEDRCARRRQLSQRVPQSLPGDAQGYDRRFSTGDDQRVEPVEVAGHANLPGLGPELTEHPSVSGEVALESEHADPRRRLIGAGADRSQRVLIPHGYQPRGASSCSVSSFEVSRLTMA